MYSILRIEKIKDYKHLSKCVRHNTRSMVVENANPERTKYNQIEITNNVDQCLNRLENRLKETGVKQRKDSVIATEVILSASKEFFKNADRKTFYEWVEKNKQFAIREFGEDNILQIALHCDEQTPHFHIIFTPITADNKLSMKDLYGGSSKLSALQTRYSNAMKQFGLKRGKEGSKAKHTTIKDYYSFVNRLSKLTDKNLKKADEYLDDLLFDQEEQEQTRAKPYGIDWQETDLDFEPDEPEFTNSLYDELNYEIQQNQSKDQLRKGG